MSFVLRHQDEGVYVSKRERGFDIVEFTTCPSEFLYFSDYEAAQTYLDEHISVNPSLRVYEPYPMDDLARTLE